MKGVNKKIIIKNCEARRLNLTDEGKQLFYGRRSPAGDGYTQQYTAPARKTQNIYIYHISSLIIEKFSRLATFSLCCTKHIFKLNKGGSLLLDYAPVSVFSLGFWLSVLWQIFNEISILKNYGQI